MVTSLVVHVLTRTIGQYWLRVAGQCLDAAPVGDGNREKDLSVRL